MLPFFGEFIDLFKRSVPPKEKKKTKPSWRDATSKAKLGEVAAAVALKRVGASIKEGGELGGASAKWGVGSAGGSGESPRAEEAAEGAAGGGSDDFQRLISSIHAGKHLKPLDPSGNPENKKAAASHSVNNSDTANAQMASLIKAASPRNNAAGASGGLVIPKLRPTPQQAKVATDDSQTTPRGRLSRAGPKSARAAILQRMQEQEQARTDRAQRVARLGGDSAGSLGGLLRRRPSKAPSLEDASASDATLESSKEPEGWPGETSERTSKLRAGTVVGASDSSKVPATLAPHRMSSASKTPRPAAIDLNPGMCLESLHSTRL